MSEPDAVQGFRAYLRECLEQIAEAAEVPVAIGGHSLLDGRVVDDIVKQIRALIAERDHLQAVLTNELALKEAAQDELEAALAGGNLIPRFHDDALLTLPLAADVLTVSYSTITKWTARGEFCPEAFKLPNGEYRVRYRDLVRWALSLRTAT